MPFENYIQEEEKWSFAIITDIHLGRGYTDYGPPGFDDYDEDGNPKGEPQAQDYYLTKRLDAVVNKINTELKDKHNVKFVVVLGDFTDKAEKSQFWKAKEILDKLNDPNGDGDTSDGIPYIPIIGNHEFFPWEKGEQLNRPIGNESFEKIFWDKNEKNTHLINGLFKDSWIRQEDLPGYEGSPYFSNYAFSYGGINFICVDVNVRADKRLSLLADISSETEGWFERYINIYKEDKETPVVIFSHEPLYHKPRKVHPQLFLPSAMPRFMNIDAIIKNSDCKVLNFAGHVHGFDASGFPFFTDQYKDTNCEYEDTFCMGDIPVVLTEAVVVGSNEDKPEGVKGIIRIVNVSGKDIEYEAEKAEGEFSSLNPRFTYSPEDISVAPQGIKFKAHTFTKREISSFEWDLGWDRDEEGNIITVSKSGEEVEYAYREAGPRTITLTVTDNEGVTENITGSIDVSTVFKEAHCICGVKEGLEVVLPEKGEDATESAQNTPERVAIFRQHSEEKPAAEIRIHFENATEDIDLSNLTADVNLTTRKSVIYMPSWPKEIEESKILYIPSTGKGAVYICENATSLEEVSFENADVVINVGEMKEGMIAVTTLYNDTEYYVVFT